MSTLAPIALMLANLAEMTDDQFRAFVDGLRRELAPRNFLEQFLVERIAQFINRMRRSARVEAEGQPPDAKWQRYEAAAERGFWNAYKELMKGRRPQAKAASKAEPVAPVAVAPQPVAAPIPAPAPVVAPPQPQPRPAPPAAALPPRPEPRRADRSATAQADLKPWQAKCLAVLANAPARSSFVPISVTPKAGPAAGPAAEPVTAGS